jgi:hypothetical protein
VAVELLNLKVSLSPAVIKAVKKELGKSVSDEDFEAPLVSEAFSYALFGKDGGRTLGCVVDNLLRACGLDPHAINQKAWEEEEEERKLEEERKARAALAQANREARLKAAKIADKEDKQDPWIVLQYTISSEGATRVSVLAYAGMDKEKAVDVECAIYGMCHELGQEALMRGKTL